MSTKRQSPVLKTPGPTGINDLGDPNLRPDHLMLLCPNTFHELDDNPARGGMQRARFRAEHGDQGGNSGMESPSTLFAKFIRIVGRVDRALQGDAKQSWGMVESGESLKGDGSTAAKPTKDVVYLNSAEVDLKELKEIMDLLLLAMGDKVPGDVRKSLEEKTKEIFATWQKFKEEPAKVVFKKQEEEVKDIKEELERERKKKERRKQIATELLGQLKTLREETAKIDFKAAEAPAKPKPFTIPGKPDDKKLSYTYYKMTVYYIKDKSGKKGLFTMEQLEGHRVFEIQTDVNDLWPMSYWEKSLEDGPLPRRNGWHIFVTRYPAGCTYIYRGAPALYGDLPSHP